MIFNVNYCALVVVNSAVKSLLLLLLYISISDKSQYCCRFVSRLTGVLCGLSTTEAHHSSKHPHTNRPTSRQNHKLITAMRLPVLGWMSHVWRMGTW